MAISRDLTLKTSDARFLLRPPVMDDVENIYDAVYISKADLMPWMDWCRPDFSIDVPLEWVRNQPAAWEEGTNYQFVIIDNVLQQILGGCGINHINKTYLHANLGYWIRSDRTSEGLASETTKLLAKFGFEHLGLRRIEIVTGVENWASRRVAEKSGATFEGILRRRMKLGGKNIDAAMFSLIPEDIK